MKKKVKILSAVFIVISLILFASCEFLDELFGTELGYGYDIVTAKESKTWTYDSNYPICEVPSDVKTVTIKNAPKDKTLYLVKRNLGQEIIKFNDTRKIESPTRNAIDEQMIDLTELQKENLLNNTQKFVHYHPSNTPKINFSSARSALSSPTKTYNTSVVIDYEIGDSKDIYVDNSTDMESYTKKKAYLRAKGTYCNIWVVNGYWAGSSTASGKQVNQTTVNNYASKFDEIYPYIRNVFGDESDCIIEVVGNEAECIDIEDISDTGTKVNIVVYDIGVSKNGVLGYFHSKDYFKPTTSSSNAIKYSNMGKYFYIDSEYANSVFANTVSTLAHEFQHMINFNKKVLEANEAPALWYNEMLSMLCEDIMQNKLGIQDEDSPKARIKNFNAGYFISGITEFLNGESTQGFSYATAYTLGAWLARQYGGAELLKEISENIYIDQESIVEAVNTQKKTAFTFDDLMMQFLLALTGNSTYTHNKSYQSSTVTYNGYKYPLTEIDIDSSNSLYSLTSEKEYRNSYEKARYSHYNWYGPFLYNNVYGCDIRGENGITIHGIKEYTSSGEDTIEFSSKGADTLMMYLIIQ